MKLFKVVFAFLLTFVDADWDRSVYELTYADDLEEIIEVESMVFVLYEDKAHEDSNFFLTAFDAVALEFLDYGVSPLQWFKIDTLLYPDMEDLRTKRAIHAEDKQPKSAQTGNP
jgi:hypothetical protein